MIRRATLDDIEMLAWLFGNPETGFLPLDEIEESLSDPDRIWLTDDEGAFLCIGLERPPLRRIYLSHLLPETMGVALARQLVKFAVQQGYEQFAALRNWKIITIFPPEREAAAVMFANRFGPLITREDLSGGFIKLSMPRLRDAYESVQTWPL